MHITIALPVFNRVDLTKQCVDSIVKNTNFNTYNLMFIDNGSTDGTKAYLNELDQALGGIKIITNSLNLGFPKACNQILDNFKGDAVVILNNDTTVPKNWLHDLSAHLREDTGIVGCKMIGLDGSTIHVAASIVKNKIEHFEYAGPAVVDLVNGACMLISRKLADTKLRFDESYGLGYFEEFTYELEAKKIGFNTVYVPDVKITHLRNGTSSTIPEINKLFDKNWATFQQRYLLQEVLDKEKVSIIIPTYNHCDVLKKCVDSIFKYTDVEQTELIIVANGCTDETEKYLESLPDYVKYVWSPSPLGYSKAINAGINVATGTHLILLNNDTELLPRKKNQWIDTLLDPFKKDPSVGLTGPMMGYSDPAEDYFLIFFCVMISRKAIDKIGLLDESFGIGAGEDTAYCIEARKAGFKVLQVPNQNALNKAEGTALMIGNFPIYHQGEATVHDKNCVADWGANLEKNKDILSTRYGKKFKASRKKLLLVGFDTPIVPTGYASTLNSISQGLIKKGYEVYSIAGNLDTKESFNHNGMHVLSNVGDMYPNKETFLKHYEEVKPDFVMFHNDIYRIAYIVDLPDEIKKKMVLWLPIEKNGVDGACISTLNQIDHVAVVSDFAYKALQGKVSCEIHKVYHQVDTNIFKPLGNVHKQFTVIRNDRNQPRKLWGLTFKVWQQFAKDKKDVRFIAKTNPYDCCGKDLIKIVQKLGLESSVVFNADHVSQEKMNDLYNESEVFLSTTGSEGFGLALAEASASGLPVVAPNFPPVDEVLNYGASGRLIDLRESYFYKPMNVFYEIIDIDNAVKHLNELYDDWKKDGSTLKYMSMVGRQYVVDRYEVSKVVDSWDSVFNAMKEKKLKKRSGIERLEVGIVTRNRQDYLSCLLTSLLAQTYTNFDVKIIDNNDDETMIQNPLIMSLLRRLAASGHQWNLWRGDPKTNCPSSHQKILDGTKCNYVFKLDDDLILDNMYFERLMKVIQADEDVAAVGGIFLQPHESIEKQRLPQGLEPTMKVLYNNVQWYKQPNDQTIQAEHLYSSFIYRREYMNEVGGFPKNLSSLAFREETLTTYKLFKKGYRLVIVPNAIAFHFQNSNGGVRSIDRSKLEEMANHDSKIFDEQIALLNQQEATCLT